MAQLKTTLAASTAKATAFVILFGAFCGPMGAMYAFAGALVAYVVISKV